MISGQTIRISHFNTAGAPHLLPLIFRVNCINISKSHNTNLSRTTNFIVLLLELFRHLSFAHRITLAMATDVNLLTALLTHLTLPPRLPPGKDIDDAVLAPALADLALQGVSNLKKLVGDELSSSYNIIDATLEASRSLQCGEGLDKSKLLRQFEVLQETSLSAFLFVQVPAQNAGLLIWKCLG